MCYSFFVDPFILRRLLRFFSTVKNGTPCWEEYKIKDFIMLTNRCDESLDVLRIVSLFLLYYLSFVKHAFVKYAFVFYFRMF